mgnify:CR=1 FL=1
MVSRDLSASSRSKPLTVYASQSSRTCQATAWCALPVRPEALGQDILLTGAPCEQIVPVVPFRLQDLGYSNVGSKTGWLVAAYAAGLIVSSPPVAWAGNRFRGRRMPLLFALCFMAGAVILFMETASFTAMIISRILQWVLLRPVPESLGPSLIPTSPRGISGTGLWTLGLALVTDSVPEERVGMVMVCWTPQLAWKSG